MGSYNSPYQWLNLGTDEHQWRAVLLLGDTGCAIESANKDVLVSKQTSGFALKSVIESKIIGSARMAVEKLDIEFRIFSSF